MAYGCPLLPDFNCIDQKTGEPWVGHSLEEYEMHLRYRHPELHTDPRWRILKMIRQEPRETKEIMKELGLSRRIIMYRLQQLRAERFIRGKQIKSGFCKPWIWWSIECVD